MSSTLYIVSKSVFHTLSVRSEVLDELSAACDDRRHELEGRRGHGRHIQFIKPEQPPHTARIFPNTKYYGSEWQQRSIPHPAIQKTGKIEGGRIETKKYC